MIISLGISSSQSANIFWLSKYLNSKFERANLQQLLYLWKTHWCFEKITTLKTPPRHLIKMYVTRPLSQLRKSAELVSQYPEGPNSGHLVIQDEESETYYCFGSLKNRMLEELPFPQNKKLTVRYSTGAGRGRRVYLNQVFLIPVLNQPLYRNRYYAIVPQGPCKGYVLFWTFWLCRYLDQRETWKHVTTQPLKCKYTAWWYNTGFVKTYFGWWKKQPLLGSLLWF